ncbi:MAG: c-type cytochrome, partial [Mucilaginibacter sp.]
VKPEPFSVQYLTKDLLTDLTPADHKFALDRFMQTRRGNKYEPPSREGTILFGLGGGAEWGGTSVDPDGVMYVNANNMPWDLRMLPVDSMEKAMVSGSKRAFMANCAVCHGADMKGGGGIPSLVNIGQRMDIMKIYQTMMTGRGRMPSFKRLPEEEVVSVIRFLYGGKLPEYAGQRSPHNAPATHHAPRPPSKPLKPGEIPKFPYAPPFMSNGFVQFRGPDGYPAIKPPWGTLNAIDLKTGDYVWKVPLGEYAELTKKGIKPTGTENHGGMVVTAGGLVFIAATEDGLIRAFDKDSGQILWQYKLPTGGFATPISYAIDGKQYVVIAAGGGRGDLKSGGSYVAFALPD